MRKGCNQCQVKTAEDAEEILLEAQYRYARAREYIRARRLKIAYQHFINLIEYLTPYSKTSRDSRYLELLGDSHYYKAYTAHLIAKRDKRDCCQRNALAVHRVALNILEELTPTDDTDESREAQLIHLLRMENFANELRAYGDFVGFIKQVEKILKRHKQFSPPDETSRELRLAASIAFAQASLGARTAALATIESALTIVEPASLSDASMLRSYGDLCKQKAALL